MRHPLYGVSIKKRPLLGLCKRSEIPLSHYNSITKPRARFFFLSLLEDLSIDFPSHFIISIIDAYRDTTTHDKLIFPSAIMRILRNFFVHIPDSPYFTIIGAISTVSVQQSEVQL